MSESDRPSLPARLVATLEDLAGIVAGRAQLFDPFTEPEFAQIYRVCGKYTMTSWQRMYCLYKAVKYIVAANVEGDLVECGVWKGGSVMMMAHTLRAINSTDRRLYLYDTFEGMTAPTARDIDALSARPAGKRWPRTSESNHARWNYAPIAAVQSNLNTTGYPQQKVIFVKGRVEETIPSGAPAKIAILRLDTDFYASTLHELRHLYPKLSVGGVLILDDYGYWRGARDAVDEYFSEIARPPLLARVDYSGRVAVKPPAL